MKTTTAKFDPLTDWMGFYEALQNESARGAVIIAGAFLDAQLRNLISKSLIDDPPIVDQLLGSSRNSETPLSSFSSRIKAAYCLSLIDKRMYDDLEAVRKIRNKWVSRLERDRGTYDTLPTHLSATRVG